MVLVGKTQHINLIPHSDRLKLQRPKGPELLGGINCTTHICLMTIVSSNEWCDMSPEGQTRSWSGEIPNPFKPGPQSPLLRIPGGGSPLICKPDILHVYNLGVGADMAIGGILAIQRMGLWSGTTIPAALNHAYDRFRQWCSLFGKYPFIKHFDLGKFRMTSCLVLI